ncbi:hypothetical protein LY13_002463 [Prauserella aidingensis]|uniref:hypothetical protein n=1 Tax=Prauserella aidingensis TaxID=387890 RepID=UPI0020A356DE|nr:hypothetical protein [Prauserella aidingensis]MCP2253709.1 hypothetical protein [Prauserella aidingensis]
MAAHTHDDVDRAARLWGMRALAEPESTATTEVADRITGHLATGATGVDIGRSGAGRREDVRLPSDRTAYLGTTS